jgi:hypothetical protein
VAIEAAQAAAMSPFDLNAGQPNHAGFAPMSDASNVQWIRPDRPAYLPPSTSTASVAGRSARATAMIVIALTLACTFLAVYDLFLLAAGA